MGQSGSVIISLMDDENLRFVLQPSEGGGMDDAVPIALEAGPIGMFGFLVEAASRFRSLDGVWGEGFVF